jgi:MFS family permease
VPRAQRLGADLARDQVVVVVQMASRKPNSGQVATFLAGALSDYYGRRRTFRIGLIGFGVASVACGLAPNMEVLIGSRLVQGGFGPERPFTSETSR